MHKRLQSVGRVKHRQTLLGCSFRAGDAARNLGHSRGSVAA
jgi:hypothetical protein